MILDNASLNSAVFLYINSLAHIRDFLYSPLIRFYTEVEKRSTYLGAVAKTAKSDHHLRHVCPSAWNNSAPTARILVKTDILELFEYLPVKFKFH